MSGILPVHTYLDKPKLSKLEQLLMDDFKKCKDVDEQNVLVELATAFGMRTLVTEMHKYYLMQK